MNNLILLTQLPDATAEKIARIAGANGYEIKRAENRDECQEILPNKEVMALFIHNRLVQEDNRLLEVLKFYSNKVQLVLFMEGETFRPKEHLTQGVVGVISGNDFTDNALLTHLSNAQRFHGLEEKVESQGALLQDNQSITNELNLKNKVLERERNFNDSIISSIAYGLMIVDTEGAIMLVNQVGKDLYGLTVKDYYGINFEGVVHPAFRDNVAPIVKEIMVSGKSKDIEGFWMNQDLIVSVNLSVIQDNHKNNIGVMFLGRDITEAEQMQNQLFQAEKLTTMGTMLSGIAHELRNPLTIINARAQRVLESNKTPVPERLKKSVESIENQSRRCGEIVNTLLDFARKRGGGLEITSVEDLIERALKFLAYEGRLLSKSIKFKWNRFF